VASINKFIGIGNLTRDPEVKYMANGEAVCNFSIACNDSYKNKDGEKVEKVEYINIVMYRKLAEIAGEYLKKGRPVYVEGRLQTRKWEKDGVDRYTTEIIADSMQMLGGKDSSTNESVHDTRTSQKTEQPTKAAQTGNAGFDDFEDDLPF
jgi:single-strand DNA-binding protein